jgi:hypothetical protein
MTPATCFYCGLVVRTEQKFVIMQDPNGSGQLVVAHKEHTKSASNTQYPPQQTAAAAEPEQKAARDG